MQTRLIFIITFLLTACTPSTILVPTPTLNPSFPTTTTQGDNPIMTSTPPMPSGSGLQNLIEKAKGDLAQRLSIPENEIILLNATDVVWPDSSLGCPQKGIVYADMLTPGYLIILSADSREYEYHTSKGTEMVPCENPNPPVPNMPGDT